MSPNISTPAADDTPDAIERAVNAALRDMTNEQLARLSHLVDVEIGIRCRNEDAAVEAMTPDAADAYLAAAAAADPSLVPA